MVCHASGDRTRAAACGVRPASQTAAPPRESHAAPSRLTLQRIATDSSRSVPWSSQDWLKETTKPASSLNGTGGHNWKSLRRRVLYPLSYGRTLLATIQHHAVYRFSRVADQNAARATLISYTARCCQRSCETPRRSAAADELRPTLPAHPASPSSRCRTRRACGRRRVAESA